MADWSPIYDDGTASVETGDATVIGQGTFWATNGLRIGDQFRAQGLSVTIEEIVSDTEIAIKPWPGADLAEDGYEIIRVNDADRLIAATQVFMEHMLPNISAFALLNGSAGKVPVFTGTGAMSLVDKGSLVEGVFHDAVVANLAGRAAHDDAAEDFGVLVTDIGDGRSAIYFKLSADSADWSDPAYVTGVQGFDGISAGLPFRFSASTSISVPASGDIRLNHADFDSVTQAAVSDGIFTDGTPDASAYVNLWSAGKLVLAKRGAPENFAVYKVTSCVDNTDWTRLNLEFIAASGSFSAGDALAAQFLADAATDSAAAAAASAVAAAASASAAADDADATAADRVQTGLDRIATGEDATATAADRVQTGEDRVATGEDATATAADRVQTNEDRIATGEDAVATAADRVQTGLDRIATGEDATATAADRVQTGEDRVATGDDAAATAADRVQTGEDRVATGDDAAATAADRVQTAEDRVATGEDAAATAADRIQTGEDRVATGEDAAATAADRVQTGLDVLAASVSKDDAGVFTAQALGYKDETSALKALTEALKSSVDVSYADLTALIGTLPDLSGVTAAMLGKAVRLLAATDIVASCWWISGADEMKAIRRGEKARSYYNEPLNTATRGSRREMPQAKLVVARAGSVTIYDMDNGGAMWLVFPAIANGLIPTHNAVSSVDARNGFLIIGDARASSILYGVAFVDFIRDKFWRHSNNDNCSRDPGANIAARGTAILYQTGTVTSFIVSGTVNSVAAYVAPGTPVDPVRRLPAPTIAVGTAGGVSVIHPDGRVCNSAVTSAITSVQFGQGGTLFYGGLSSTSSTFYAMRVDYWTTPFTQRSYVENGVSAYPAVGGGGTTGMTVIPGGFVKGHAAGLSLFRHEPGSGNLGAPTSNRSSVAYITRDYNTGWMTGQILMALAESTRDQTSYVDTEIATGGNFDTDISGWTQASVPFPGVWDAGGGNGRAKLDGASNGGNTGLFRDYAVTAGQAYRVSDVIEAIGAIGFVRFYDGAAFSTILASHTTAGTNTSFVVPSTSVIRVYGLASAAQAFYFDSISIKRAVRDRSAAGNHAQVVGSVGRTPVATNAELCAYTGFSASNYLEALKGADLSGDFFFGGWFSTTTLASARFLFTYQDGVGGLYGSNNHMVVVLEGSGRISVQVNGGTAIASSASTALPAVNTWTYVAVWRRAGTFYLQINNTIAASAANAANITNANASLRIGVGYYNSSLTSAWSGSIASIFKAGLSAPTPAQIRQAYADELAMFQPGAKCLLSGSGSVNQPGYDKGTGSLYAPQTTGGTDVFIGLCRIATRNMASVGAAMTSDNHKSVVAENDNVAFVTANEVYVETPTIGLREHLLKPQAETPYDRNTIRAPSAAVTTNATPTVIGYLPMDKGEAGEWFIRVSAREYGEPGSPELASYEVRVTAARPQEGNVTVSGSAGYTVVSEVTSSMDLTVAANTTAQALALTATGVSSKNIEWGFEARFVPATQQVAA